MNWVYLYGMKTEIITIGDELLIGQVVNTNASWMAEQLTLAGFAVHRTTVIPDDHDEIVKALAEAGERSEIVLITGGLGPTKDDITKAALCRFFGVKLVFSDEVYKDVEHLFRIRGWPVTKLNRRQAEIPEGSRPVRNRNGTAAGLWFEGTWDVGRRTWDEGSRMTDKGRRVQVYVSMPGVPFEMKEMMTESIIPDLRELFHPGGIFHKTILTQGVGESFLSDILEPWETALPPEVRLAYLPQPGMVRLRLTGRGEDKERVTAMVEAESAKLEALIPEFIYGYNNDTLEEIVGRILSGKKATLATAESCTGGYIAHLITTVPGSSDYFKGSVVAYSNELKEELLGVSPDRIQEHGAVSEAVVAEMAIGAQTHLDADYVIAVSGIAGPGGGTPEKPVGTTWIAIATPAGVSTHHYLLGDHRERNIRRAALQALNLLRKSLLENG